MSDSLDNRQSDNPRPPKRRRRWLSYSLRGLFVLVFAAAVGSWWTRTKLDQFAAEYEAIEQLRNAGGRIQTVPAAPQWFWKLFPKKIAQRCEHAFHADLHPMQTTDADMALVGRLTRLETLIVRSKLITDEGCSHCRGLTRLRCLWLLGSASITSRGLEQFLGAEALTNLQFAFPSVGDEEMEVVVRFRRLEGLLLWSTRVGDSGLRRITALKRLSRLVLPRTVTRRGLRDLSELPELQNLRLSISATDNGPVFDSVARLPRLVQLDILGDGLTDADLAQIAKAPRLESLDIRGGRVSESGLLALKDAPKLRAFMVHDPWFQAGTQERLAKHLSPISVQVYERPSEEERPSTREEFLQRAAREIEGRGGAAPERDERSAIGAGREPDDTRLALPPRRRADGTRQRGPGRAPPRGAPRGSDRSGGGRLQGGTWPGGASGGPGERRGREHRTGGFGQGTRSEKR